MTQPLPSRRLRAGVVSRRVILAVTACLLAVPVISLAVPERFPQVPADGFGVVTYGPLELIVSERGEIESSRNGFVISQCEWSTPLVWIVPEGTWVEAGEVVAELDTSELLEKSREREIRVVNAEAAFALAEENLRIQKLQNQSLLANAQLQATLTQLQLEGYQEAEYPQQLHQLQSAQALAEEELNSAHKMYDFVREMVKLGYRYPNELESERLKVRKAEQKFQSAGDALRMLTDYTLARQMAELKARSVEARHELDRVKTASRSNVLSKEVQVHSRRRSFEVYRTYLERVKQSLANCTLRAPQAGEVIHCRRSSSDTRGVEEGDYVRFLQPLIELPDRNHMRVAMRMHESRIRCVQEGLPAVITVDAISGERLTGRVRSVSKVPTRGRFPNYDLREYEVFVDVETQGEICKQLAPGMTASVDVIAARKSRTLRAPISSVAQVGGRYVAFVRNGDDVEARDVEVGLTNDEMVEITAGLQTGDEVVLRPRVLCAQRLAALQSNAAVVDASSWTQQGAL